MRKVLKDQRRPRDATNSSWSSSQRVEAVQTWLITGSIAATSRALGIPEQTIYTWKRAPWWGEIVEDLRIQDELQLSARMRRIVERTLDVMEDRLENGDFVYDQKTGSMRRKPVNMRDAAKASIDFQHRRDTLAQRNAPQASEEQMADKLLKLAKQFEEMASSRKKELEYVDEVVSPNPSPNLLQLDNVGTDSEEVFESVGSDGQQGDDPVDGEQGFSMGVA